MASLKEPVRAHRDWKRWNVEALKLALRDKNRTLKSILNEYATASTGWRGLYNDVTRWRKMDPDLERMIKENTVVTSKSQGVGGRKRKDSINAEDADWRVRCVEEYKRTASITKAAAVTPYKVDEIHRMMTVGRTEYDKLFAEMMEIAEQTLVARAAESVFGALEEAEQTGASPKDKAYIALGILKTHNKGWQQKNTLDVNINGKVKFELDRSREIAELIAEQRRAFGESRPLALPSGVDESNVIDLAPIKEWVEHE